MTTDQNNKLNAIYNNIGKLQYIPLITVTTGGGSTLQFDVSNYSKMKLNGYLTKAGNTTTSLYVYMDNVNIYNIEVPMDNATKMVKEFDCKNKNTCKIYHGATNFVGTISFE